MAFTLDLSKLNPADESPDIMQLSPAYLKDHINDEQPKTCKNLETKIQSLMAKVKAANKKTADAYVDMAHMLAHDLTHTNSGGRSEDIGPNPYGWDNCVRSKNARNADSLAFMTTMTWIIENCGSEPKADGSISKIKDWKAPA